MTSETRSTYNDWLIGGSLLFVLVMTRSGHFGSPFKLPDASWAIFWLCGAFALRWYWPAIMMAACAVVDYLVINNGVSSYCVTPAYPFLIPAYLSLWFMGGWAAQSLTGATSSRGRSLLRIAVSVLNGVTFAFIISNVSFYLLAGYFSKMPALEYSEAIIKYWPGYLVHTSLYVASGLLLRYIVLALRNSRSAVRAAELP